MTRRSALGAGAATIAALVLRPRWSVAGPVSADTPTGMWGLARTDAGLVGAWVSGGVVTVVRLTATGPLAIDRTLATPDLDVVAGIAGGGAPLVLGASAEVVRRARTIGTDHLGDGARRALEDEPDGPLGLDGVVVDTVEPTTPQARTLAGVPVPAPDVPGGVLTAALSVRAHRWWAVQHPPSAEGDHCSSLTVLDGDAVVLAAHDLGSAGPASVVGPEQAPLISVSDGEGRLRLWRAGPAGVTALASPGLAFPGRVEVTAVHVAGDRPVAVVTSPEGAVLLGATVDGWEVLRDVEGTAGAGRVLAVAGSEPEFVVELPDRVVLVDGAGRVRR